MYDVYSEKPEFATTELVPDIDVGLLVDDDVGNDVDDIDDDVDVGTELHAEEENGTVWHRPPITPLVQPAVGT